MVKVKSLYTPEDNRGNRGMAPLFLDVTRWGISNRLYAPAALLPGRGAPDSHGAGLDALRKRKTADLVEN